MRHPGIAVVALVIPAATLAGGTACREQPSPVFGPQIRFVDSTRVFGLEHSGLAYAAGAADFDRDGWVDLAVSTHGSIRIFHNQAGRFELLPVDVVDEDTHGLSWIDLNRDTWIDVLVAVGANRGFGRGANQVYLNRRGNGFSFDPEPHEALRDPNGRGRCVCAHDVDHDGIQDIILMNAYQEQRWNRLLITTEDGFVDRGETTGLRQIRAECITTVNDPERGSIFLAYGGGRDSGHAYRIDSAGKFVDVTENIGLGQRWRTVYATAVGDFDNDGDLDLYQVHGHEVPPEVVNIDGGLGFRLVTHRRGDIPQFSFHCAGTFLVDLLIGFNRHSSMVFLGRDRAHPTTPTWSVHPEDERIDGEPKIDPDTDLGVFFWRSAPDVYTVAVVGDGQRVRGISGKLTTQERITVTEAADDLIAPKRAQSNRILMNHGGRFIDTTETAGIADPHSGRDAVAFDADNDGDLDLFVVNGGMAFANQPDVLYLNRGDGTFVEASEAAGVTGPVWGRGSTATALDADNDGDLDLFVTNGDGPPHGNEGPYVFWENRTEGIGNWVKVDLKGPAGNPFGVGSTIVAAFGNRLQARQRSSTDGRFSTGAAPIHFGIGRATEVAISVTWPTGRATRLVTKANRQVTVEHPSAAKAHDGHR